MLRICVVLTSVSLLIAGCRESTAVPADPHLQRAEELFARYVSIDSSGSAQGYAAAAALLRDELRANGIEPQILTPGGAEFPIVYARLESGTADSGALILLHHMDVVAADTAQWSVPPFSGRRANGYLWGRGAIDDKSLGIAHLEAFLDLHRTRATLMRDVVFLAVPDEERGGMRGVGALLASNPAMFTPRDVVLTEGGSTDTTVDEVSIWSIDVAQKVPLWIRIVTRSRGGHGATSSGSASESLVDVLADLQQQMPLRRELDPEVARMIASRSRAFGGTKRLRMSQPAGSWRDGTLLEVLGSAERSVLTDSMVVTSLRAGYAVNVVPSLAYAEIDLRLLRSTSVDDTIERMKEIAGDRAAIEVILSGRTAPASPVDHPFYRMLGQKLIAAEPDSIVVPVVSPATTDARFFRSAGIPAYGFSPFKINFYDAGGIHGADERIRLRFFHEGTRLMREIVRAYCVAA